MQIPQLKSLKIPSLIPKEIYLGLVKIEKGNQRFPLNTENKKDFKVYILIVNNLILYLVYSYQASPSNSKNLPQINSVQTFHLQSGNTSNPCKTCTLNIVQILRHRHTNPHHSWTFVSATITSDRMLPIVFSSDPSFRSSGNGYIMNS